MTYEMISAKMISTEMLSFENLFISGFAIAISALVVAVLASLSQMKQIDLKPIPIRVRRDDVRYRRRHPRDFR